MTEAKIYVPTTDAKTPARTYNQNHQPRKFADERRRVSVYVCWSFPGEANRDIRDLDNRFSTMTEVRRVEWPLWETPEWSDPTMFQQGIAGALELFFRAWVPFQDVVGEASGHPVAVFQRIDQAGGFDRCHQGLEVTGYRGVYNVGRGSSRGHRKRESTYQQN